MNSAFEYTFPAIRGIQAKREYYVSMCPLRLIPRIFLFDEEELPPELRAQRKLNKSRLPEMANYILGNPNNYTFSAITASIDADVRFDAISPANGGAGSQQIGRLIVPMSARFIVNDGQHRRAAIELAIQEHPEMGDESIAVVFFVDRGLERCQQMFADLNRYAVRPSKSIGVLYDHRDQMAQLAKFIALKLPLFRNVVDMEKSTLAQRSRKLFTLSSIYTATSALFSPNEPATFEERAEIAITFWEEVAKNFPEWSLVCSGKITASEIRTRYLHSHGIALQAIGKTGQVLLRTQPKRWKQLLTGLSEIDWAKSNSSLWEGRAMIGGRLSKAESNVTLTTNVIKKQLKLPLSAEEQRLEEAFLRGEHAK
jgi:DNA sulfur modification protein DndB